MHELIPTPAPPLSRAALDLLALLPTGPSTGRMVPVQAGTLGALFRRARDAAADDEGPCARFLQGFPRLRDEHLRYRVLEFRSERGALVVGIGG